MDIPVESLPSDLQSMLMDRLADRFNEQLEKVSADKFNNELLTKTKVCREILHCSPSTESIDEILLAEDFPVIHIGTQRRYPRAAVNEWLGSHSYQG